MTMPKTDPTLWRRLDALSLDMAEASLPFSARLARENGWSQTFAERVAAEYKRFAYLARVCGGDVTPSDEVDQAWHLHLLYTRHYWGPFTETLGASLHHGPTEGGAAEGARFREQYARTLAAYEAEFGAPPPADVWPPASVRFTRPLTARRVHRSDTILIPRRLLPNRWLLGGGLAALLAAPALVTAHDGLGSAGEHEGGFLVGFAVHAVKEHLPTTIVTIVFAIIVGSIIYGEARGAKRKGGDGGTGCGGGGGGDDGGFGGGSGCGGCGGCGG